MASEKSKKFRQTAASFVIAPVLGSAQKKGSANFKMRAIIAMGSSRSDSGTSWVLSSPQLRRRRRENGGGRGRREGLAWPSAARMRSVTGGRKQQLGTARL